MGLLNVVPGHVLRQRHLHGGHAKIGQRQEGQLKAGRYLEPPKWEEAGRCLLEL